VNLVSRPTSRVSDPTYSLEVFRISDCAIRAKCQREWRAAGIRIDPVSAMRRSAEDVDLIRREIR
jgi:hypothetical protein